jgi:LCP family protein required for cell wall assembly
VDNSSKPPAVSVFEGSAGYPQPLHAIQKRLAGWKLIAALSAGLVSVLVLSTGIVLGLTVQNLRSNLVTVALGGSEGLILPNIGDIEGGFNVLIVGSDTRVGQGDQFDFVDSELNDVNVLVHISEDHDRAIVVSFPRDLLIDIPSCPQEDGTSSEPQTLSALNSTMGIGGLPCVVMTIEELTGLEIGYAGIMTFTGVAQLSTALGGVEVCVTAPLVDPWSGVNLPEAGYHTLEGGQALAFLRTRKGVGDGSDLARISSQQVYMAALVRTLQAEGAFNDIRKLYGIASVASQTMVLSTSLNRIDVMVSMARALRGVPNENIIFIQYPVLEADPELYPGRVIPHPDLGRVVVERLAADEPFTLAEGSLGFGSTTDGNTGEDQTPTPEEIEVVEGLVGQTAEDETCAVPR